MSMSLKYRGFAGRDRNGTAVTIVFVAGAAAQSTFKKYDIKLGIVTFETNMKMGTMNMKEKTVVYFDDHGMRECKDTYSDDELSPRQRVCRLHPQFT